MVRPMPTKAFLQLAKAAARWDRGMWVGCCAETRPRPPIPPFLLAQYPSSKWIAPTDNVHKVRRRHMASSVSYGLMLTDFLLDFTAFSDSERIHGGTGLPAASISQTPTRAPRR